MTTLHAPPELPAELLLQHAETLHASLDLSASGLKACGDLGPPLTHATLTRLRDEVAAALMTGAPLDLPRVDVETCLLSLMATRHTVEAVHAPGHPNDQLGALSLPRLEASIRRTMDVLDAPVVAVIPECRA